MPQQLTGVADSRDRRRIAAVRELLLENPPEESLHRITRSATRLLGAPFAAISLLDADNEWLLACAGLCLVEIPAGPSLAAATLEAATTFALADTRQDPRFAANPLLGDEFAVRSYLGCPLRGADGSHVGVLCVMDRQPRRFSAAEQAALADLAAWAEDVLAPSGELQRQIVAQQQQIARLEAMVDQSIDLIVVFDAHGKMQFVSASHARILGFSADEMLGKHILALMHPDDHARIIAALLAGREDYGGMWRVEFRFRHADGSWRWLEAYCHNRLDDPAINGTIVSSRDITERVEASAKLQALAAQLEISNRELNDFASIASHDLQEPLRKVQAFGDRLRLVAGPVLNDEALDYLGRMQAAAARMQTLISDLLGYSRVLTQAQPFAQVDLARVAREVLGDLEVRIEQSGGQVELGALPALAAETTQMRQLLQNLIGNALKFARPGQPPLVKVYSRTADDGNACQLVVEDNGIGFDEKYAERIFAPFQRLHGRHEYEGTGMGLAVCRKIAERHGGTIAVKSSPGHGATFVVTLPVRQ